MKSCPNPGCPVLALTGVAAEFRHDVERCTDCGSVLVEGPVTPTAEAAKTRAPVASSLWLRLAVTLLTPLLLWLSNLFKAEGKDPLVA